MSKPLDTDRLTDVTLIAKAEREAMVGAFRQMCREYPEKCNNPEDVQAMITTVIKANYPSLPQVGHDELRVLFTLEGLKSWSGEELF